MLGRIFSWKYPIAVAIILAGAVFVSRQEESTRRQYQQKCAQLNASAVSPATHYEDCDKGAENAERNLPRWYRIFGWPDGITTWAILLTLMTIAEQTRETKRAAVATEDAAKAARDSIRLQEAEMEQWVKIVNWQVLVLEPSAPGMGGRGQIKFDIVNGSHFPLTMLGATIVFYGQTIYSTGENVFMAPDTPYTVSVLVQLSVDQWSQYQSYILSMRVTGDMTHIGRLEKKVRQSFVGLLIFGKGKETHFVEEISMVPKAQPNRDEGQNPN